MYRLGLDFKLPVYLVQGTEDLLTKQQVTHRYYDAIRAPVKKLVLVPRAGHDPNVPMVEAQSTLLREDDPAALLVIHLYWYSGLLTTIGRISSRTL